MVPFCILNIIRHRIFRTIIMTTTHITDQHIVFNHGTSDPQFRTQRRSGRCTLFGICRERGQEYIHIYVCVYIYMWMFLKSMVPFWVPQNTRCRITLRTHKGAIILTTTHMVCILGAFGPLGNLCNSGPLYQLTLSTGFGPSPLLVCGDVWARSMPNKLQHAQKRSVVLR